MQELNSVPQPPVAGTVASVSHAKGSEFTQATHPIWWIMTGWGAIILLLGCRGGLTWGPAGNEDSCSQALLIGQERHLALSRDTIMKLAWKNQPRDARLVSARRRSTSSLGLNGMLT
jgi:hypothetical protein